MATLILYGNPPKTPTFQAGITAKNRRSFEALLVPQLEKLAVRSLAPATPKPICRPGDLGTLLKSGSFDTLVFYGHAFTFTTESRSGNKSELRLETACGRTVTAHDLSEALRGTTIKTVLIAGCTSNALAADLSTRVPGVKFGGIQFLRWDDISGNEDVILYFRITPQPVRWRGR